jgi:hypothetical protein
MKQHLGGFGSQVLPAPVGQPVRQIGQRHSQDCATGIGQTLGK